MLPALSFSLLLKIKYLDLAYFRGLESSNEQDKSNTLIDDFSFNAIKLTGPLEKSTPDLIL